MHSIFGLHFHIKKLSVLKIYLHDISCREIVFLFSIYSNKHYYKEYCSKVSFDIASLLTIHDLRNKVSFLLFQDSNNFSISW